MLEFMNELIHKYMYTSRKVLHKTHDQLDGVGLYRGQPPLMLALWEKDEQSRKELCDSLSRTPATITKMVSRLTKSGFVHSKKDEKDYRISRVCLTEQGKSIQRDVNEVFDSLHKSVFYGFSDEELADFEKYLDRINDNINNESAAKCGI